MVHGRCEIKKRTWRVRLKAKNIKKNEKKSKKDLTYGLLYVIMLSRGEGNGPKPKGGKTRKEKKMDEMANQTEEFVKQVEEKMVYKILDVIRNCKSAEEAEEKIRALLIK